MSDKSTPSWGVNKLIADTLEIIQRGERERLHGLYSRPLIPLLNIPPPKSDAIDALGYGLWVHDELYRTNRTKGPDTMSNVKYTTIESATRPQHGRTDHVAIVKHGCPYAAPTITGEVKHGNSQAQAAEQLVLDLETAAREARKAFEAAGLVKPKPAPKPSKVAELLAERLARDLGDGAIDQSCFADVEIGGEQPPGVLGRVIKIRSVFTSPNGTRVEYTRNSDVPVTNSLGTNSILQALNLQAKP